MRRFQSTFVLMLVSSSHAFQFMSNWKITPPGDAEKQQKIKDKFGDKSKLLVHPVYIARRQNDVICSA